MKKATIEFLFKTLWPFIYIGLCVLVYLQGFHDGKNAGDKECWAKRYQHCSCYPAVKLEGSELVGSNGVKYLDGK